MANDLVCGRFGMDIAHWWIHGSIVGALIPKLGNLDSWCPTLCGDDRIVNASRIKCLDGRGKPAATPHMGREQRELV